MTTAIHPIAPVPARVPRIRVPKLFARAAAAPDPPDGGLELHFVEDRALQRAAQWLARKLGGNTLSWPVAVRGQKADAVPSLPAIGLALGFGDERSQRLLHHHHEQRLRRGTFIFFSHEVLLMSLLVIGTTPGTALWSGGDSLVMSGALFLGRMLGLWAFMFFLSVLVFRLVGLLVDRHFAEALCATNAMYLLAELQREDALARADYRRGLIDRLDSLARATQLLALRYPSRDAATGARLQRHFREMIAYIHARRMWAVTPVSTTLDDLRRDVQALARVYVTGAYGEVAWRPDAGAEDERRPAWWRMALRGTSRMLGVLLPVAGFMYLREHAGAQPFGVSNEVAGGFLLAWLVYSLDNMLQMGLVSSVVGLAKSIKELK